MLLAHSCTSYLVILAILPFNIRLLSFLQNRSFSATMSSIQFPEELFSLLLRSSLFQSDFSLSHLWLKVIHFREPSHIPEWVLWSLSVDWVSITFQIPVHNLFIWSGIPFKAFSVHIFASFCLNSFQFIEIVSFYYRWGVIQTQSLVRVTAFKSWFELSDEDNGVNFPFFWQFQLIC